jgi:uncharacterized protein (DUF927 family)
VPGYYDPGRSGYARLSWKKYQSQRIDAGTLERLFRHGTPGVAIVTGKVSGIEVAGTWHGLEVMDFDDPGIFDAFIEAANYQGLGDLLHRLIRERTPRLGAHLGYFCSTVEGNQPLARRPPEEGEDGPVTLIETRGEGGQCVVAPTPPGVHPDVPTRGYVLTHGSWEHPSIITADERAALFSLARSFNRYVDAREIHRPPGHPRAGANGTRPGDTLNASTDLAWWSALLQKYGWKYINQRGDIMDWQRPGKDGPGASATLGACGPYLYVFSSNAAPFEAGRAYSPFSAYCLLEHAGDARQAARTLAQEQRRNGRHSATTETETPDEQGEPDIPMRERFHVDERGVWYTPPEDKEGNQPADVWVCAPLRIVAATRDVDNNNHGHLLEFNDRHGSAQEWAMPLELLEEQREYRKVLRRLGLVMNSAAREALQKYLDVCHAEARARCVDRVGWYGAAYVLPDATLGNPGNERLVLQNLDRRSEGYRQAGTLESWRTHVSLLCIGNSRLILAVSMGFASALLPWVDAESGGLHFRGSSSEGKTTAMYVAGSLWGEQERLENWRATANGLEGVALAHNDNLLCLDEIRQVDPKEAGSVAYMLANGVGKRRGKEHGGARPRLKWRLLFLSSGELSLEQHMADAGHRIQAGQEVRLIDMPADAGTGFHLFENVHGSPTGQAFAERLKAHTTQHYGHAGRAFVAQFATDIPGFTAQIRACMDALLRQLLPDDAAGQVYRVARRFALIAAAGELATAYALTGWSPGDAAAAATRCFRDWLEQRGSAGNTDETRALGQVRLYFERYGRSRFEPWRESDGETCQRCRGTGLVEYTYAQGVCFACNGTKVITPDHPAIRLIQVQAGWSKATDDGGTEFYVQQEIFRQDIAKGLDVQWLCRILKAKGYLLPDSRGKNMRRERLPGRGLGEVYRITAHLLGAQKPGEKEEPEEENQI